MKVSVFATERDCKPLLLVGRNGDERDLGQGDWGRVDVRSPDDEGVVLTTGGEVVLSTVTERRCVRSRTVGFPDSMPRVV